MSGASAPQVREAVHQEMVAAAENNPAGKQRRQGSSSKSGRFAAGPSGKYSRLEAEVSAMQRDSSTYCDEPEDADDFGAWLQVLRACRAQFLLIVGSNWSLERLRCNQIFVACV
jgi:hypothetical protein